MSADWRDLTDYEFCACCGKPLAGFVQHFDAKYRIPDRPYVTCPTEACGMHGLTHAPQRHRELATECKARV